MKRAISVIGYPRSGNTWVSRILGDILESPVGGAFNAKPLCTEGQERPGAYRIQQLHQKADYHLSQADNAYTLSVPGYTGEPTLVLVIRDPRDVVVSAMHYWNVKTVSSMLSSVGVGGSPVGVHGVWQGFYRDWLESGLPYTLVRFEDILMRPCAEWRRIMSDLENFGIKYREERIKEVVERQEFNAKKAQITIDGDGRPYGKTIQQKHLRKGEAGDWRNHFTEEERQLARTYFASVAMRFGYTL